MGQTMIDDYEEGEIMIPVRKKWYQIWIPKTVFGGTYTRIGSVVRLNIINMPFGPVSTIVEMENKITKLPYMT